MVATGTISYYKVTSTIGFLVPIKLARQSSLDVTLVISQIYDYFYSLTDINDEGVSLVFYSSLKDTLLMQQNLTQLPFQMVHVQ